MAASNNAGSALPVTTPSTQSFAQSSSQYAGLPVPSTSQGVALSPAQHFATPTPAQQVTQTSALQAAAQTTTQAGAQTPVQSATTPKPTQQTSAPTPSQHGVQKPAQQVVVPLYTQIEGTSTFKKFHKPLRYGLNFAGFKDNYHTINQISIYRREIILVADVGLHLVWKQSPTAFHFIKPLPRAFIDDNYRLSTPVDKLTKLTAGFLYSYSRLIKSQQDLDDALKYKLIDGRFANRKGFEHWQKFVGTFIHALDLDNKHGLDKIDQRYHYGDLRLDRLNILMMFWGVRLLEGEILNFYHTRDPVHSFWQGYGKWVLIIFAYVTTILTAMQVALAASTDPMGLTQTFKWFAYVILLLIGIQLPFITFFYMLLAAQQVFGWLRKKNKESRLNEGV